MIPAGIVTESVAGAHMDHIARALLAAGPRGTFNGLAFAVISAQASLFDNVRAVEFLAGLSLEEVAALDWETCPRYGVALNPAKLRALAHYAANIDEWHAARLRMTAREYWDHIMTAGAGLGLVKAAFATQFLYGTAGSLGCIDTHNAKLPCIAAARAELGFYGAISGKSAPMRARYVYLQATKTSAAWWADWCNEYVSKPNGRVYPDGLSVSLAHFAALKGL